LRHRSLLCGRSLGMHKLLSRSIPGVHWLKRLFFLCCRVLLHVDGPVVLWGFPVCHGDLLQRWCERVLIVFSWFLPAVNGAVELHGM